MEYGLNAPQVAVIIATKNRPTLLGNRALSSVLKQSQLPNYLIVVDDSSDRTARQQNKMIVDSISSNNFKIEYLMNKRTYGASGAWNTAIEYLSTKVTNPVDSQFIAFLDDDDEWHFDYLESCLSVVSTYNCNMVATGFNRYENGTRVPIECSSPESLNDDLFLCGNPGIQGSNLFLSLEVVLMAGCFDERLPSCTDRDLCIRLSELDLVKYQSINKPLLNHYADNDRQRLSTPNSQSKRKGLNVFWLKYYGRMSSEQRQAFLERSKRLFGWQPEQHQQVTIRQQRQTAITLGIELGSTPISQINQVIEIINREGKVYIVGFNLVFTAIQDADLSELGTLLETTSRLGITCYNLTTQKTGIETATALVAKENIGNTAWILNERSHQNQPLHQDTNIIANILMELGFHELAITHYVEEQTLLIQKIKQCRIDEAHNRVYKLFSIGDLRLLGVGSEAIVLSDGKRVFKCIDYWKNHVPGEQIQFLQQNGSLWRNLPGLYELDEIITDGNTVVLTYAYEVSTPYQGGNSGDVINLLHSCSKAGIVCNNIHPKNLIRTFNEVKLIDYGSDIRPWNELGFEHMARRAYLSIHYADHPHLKYIMRQSLHRINLPEMQGYQEFRQKLTGIDCNLRKVQQSRLGLASPRVFPIPFSLTIGVITGNPQKLLPLLNSIAVLRQYKYLSEVNTHILCNGCSSSSLRKTLANSIRPIGEVQILSEKKQIEDARNGLFGPDLVIRPNGQVGIAQARCMLQKYIGLKCIEASDSIAWILDDDMRLDERAKEYLAWLPRFKQAGIDIVIGQYEGASPNPPLNGLRGQLVDLLHNIRWLDELPSYIELPDRSQENKVLREQYPDYYYDLSRKHTAHLETPFWLEPAYKGETVSEARARLIACSPLLVSGFPLTRGITPVYSADPLRSAKDTVNRGGNTFVLNPLALTQTPNLIQKIDGREARRSDMIWAIINKQHYRLNIKSAPFPVQHSGWINNSRMLNLPKVQDEIMGSALYAGLQYFLGSKPEHELVFTPAEINDVWQKTTVACNTRLSHLKLSFFRVQGLSQSFAHYPELSELCGYLNNFFSTTTLAKLEAEVNQMSVQHISQFLKQIIPQTTRFANVQKQIIERAK